MIDFFLKVLFFYYFLLTLVGKYLLGSFFWDEILLKSNKEAQRQVQVKLFILSVKK